MGEKRSSSQALPTMPVMQTWSRAQIQAARDDQERRYGTNMRYGPLHEIEIDERPAWAWLETQIYRGNVSSLEYKAVVSYDSVAYAVEFWSDQAQWMDETKLREVVASFAVGRIRISWPLMLVGLVGVLGFKVFLRSQGGGIEA